MLKKQIFFVLLCFTTWFFNPLPKQLQAEEVDKGLVIIDNKPWKISWIKDETTWILLANFDKGELRTYFNKEAPKKGFELSHENKPIKQEFEFYFGKKFMSTTCQYEQWPDGAKAYGFVYEQKFERDGEKLELGTTAIIEEVGDAENEVRYSIFRVYE